MYKVQFLIQQTASLEECFLEGPYDAKYVKKHGYRFTQDKEKAWPFPSQAQARHKGRIVLKHMSWDHNEVQVMIWEGGAA